MDGTRGSPRVSWPQIKFPPPIIRNCKSGVKFTRDRGERGEISVTENYWKVSTRVIHNEQPTVVPFHRSM